MRPWASRSKTSFVSIPTFARANRHAPRSRSPRLERLRHAAGPLTPDEIAQVMLEEMIVSDPQWIEECAPARAKMWELAQASPRARAQLSAGAQESRLQPGVVLGYPWHQPPAELTMGGDYAAQCQAI